jgi:hypothetical protein
MDYTMHDLTLWNEIWEAYNERAMAVGYGTNALLTTNDSPQVHGFYMNPGTVLTNGVATIQGGLVDICGRYVNTNEFFPQPAGYWPDTGTPLIKSWGANLISPFVVTSFYQCAGITNGFRRATTYPADWTDYNDPAYSYGQAKAGDIIGPWILEDLQRGIDVLSTTAILLPVTMGYPDSSILLCTQVWKRTTGITGFTTNVTLCNTAWGANDWLDVTDKRIDIAVESFDYRYGNGYYSAFRYCYNLTEYEQHRTKSIPWIHRSLMTYPPSTNCVVTQDVDLWLQSSDPLGDFACWCSLDQEAEPRLNFLTNLEWNCIGTIEDNVSGEDAVATWPEVIGGVDDAPMTSDIGPYGVWEDDEHVCDFSNPYMEEVWVRAAYWVLRWNFTCRK